MSSVWVIGSINVDLVAQVQRFPQPGATVPGLSLRRLPGGKGANQAVAAAAAGATVHLIGRVGDDVAGPEYCAALAELGVDVSRVGTEASCSTGHALIMLDAAGENLIVVVPGANGRLAVDDLTAFRPVTGDVVLMQLEIPLEVVTAAARIATAAGATVMLNLSPYLDLDPELVQSCDVIIVNEYEAAQLAASSAAPRSLVVTRGAAGAEWEGRTARVDASAIVDTTGAGDAFTGALAAALSRGADRSSALRAAVAAGAAGVGQYGAQGWSF